MSQNFPENKTAKFEPTDAKFKCPGKKCDADQMNILSESNELLNIEKQENVVKNVNIICCANFQCWKANNNSNNTVTDEDTRRTSFLDKLKGIHVMFKIIAVLIGIIITLAGIKTTETTMEKIDDLFSFLRL